MIENQTKVSIALIDSGVDVYHQDLHSNIKFDNAQSFIKGDYSYKDNLGHGTEIAGILKTISPTALITPYKVMDIKKGDSLNIINAIISAIKNGDDIINISMGTYKKLDNEEDLKLIKLYEKVIEHAIERNIIVISSLGNDNLNLDFQLSKKKLIHVPSNFNKIISVASLNRRQELSNFSNYYEYQQFFATFGGEFLLGTDSQFIKEELIYTTFPRHLHNMLSQNKGYSYTGGCSVSTAIMSGIIANIIGIHKKYYKVKPHYDQIIEIIKKLSIYKTEYHNGHKISYFTPKISYLENYYLNVLK